jgi:hypothetical protein
VIAVTFSISAKNSSLEAQVEYLGVDVAGPYKPELYRY